MSGWRPNWIWFRPPPEAADAWGVVRERPSDTFGLLRRSFSLNERPLRAFVRVVADSRYVLWVNGVEAARGPVRSDPLMPLYDKLDVTELLRAGDNAVAALVRYYGRSTTAWRPAEPSGDLGYGSFGFELVCDGDVALTSDNQWRGQTAWIDSVEASDARGLFVPPRTHGPPPIEIADLRRMPAGWTMPNFDDAAWLPAAVLAGHGAGGPAPLTSRPIPMPIARDVHAPVLLARGDAHAAPAGSHLLHPLEELALDGAGTARKSDEGIAAGEWVSYDVGSIVCAHPFIEVEADSGTVIDLTCGEDVDDTGRPVSAPREWALRVVASGATSESAESFEAVGFRYLRVAVRTGAVRRILVGAKERLLPCQPGATFACSDPALTAIWAASLRTLELCSLDAFVDCPGREQRAWLGDAYLSSLLSLVTNPDESLPAWNLRLHAQHPRADGLLPMVAAGDFTTRRDTIPDHSLLWILGLAEMYERTGNTAIVEELLPVAERILAFFERFRGRDGLLEDVPGWVFIDWAQTARGTSIAALDAFYAWTLERFAMLAGVLGDDGRAARARTRADRTRDAFGAYWDAERRVYIDATGARRVSQQTNAIAIVGACAPQERWDGMLDHILDTSRLRRTLTPGDPGSFSDRMARQWQEPPGFNDADHVVEAQPFFAHFVHRAVVAAGRARVIPSLLRRWSPMVERGNGCLEEYWTAEPGLGSRCHAWSATPLYDIATHVLGVRPSSPGMDHIVVDPELGDLDWAEGTIATPHGFVHVRCERGEDPIVHVPPHVRASVRSKHAPRTIATPVEGRSE